MPPKRPHSPPNDSRSNAKLRGSLTWNKAASQPKFLRNALAALQGQPSSAQDKGLGPDGRPAVPGRPGGAADEGEESEEDEWDFGRGEEAPAVVVLKDKHLGRDEVDRMRAEAKASSSLDPLATSSAPPPPTKNTGSLNLASGSSKDKAGPKATEPGTTESWDDVIQRAKADAAAKSLSAEQAREEEAKKAEKEAKKKKKDKVKAKKQIKMLSFDDD